MEDQYNPLDKQNLGQSVTNALLRCPVVPLAPSRRFKGAGVYAIYYVGDFPAYARIASQNLHNRFEAPIYIGKAIPAGGRKGGFDLSISPGRVLYSRLAEHAKSIEQAQNLRLDDFQCRYLVVDDIWIPLAETLMITKYRPTWNMFIDGFGNHPPGGRRVTQQKSPWDVIHPGRPWANDLAPNPKSADQILAMMPTSMPPGLG